MDDVCGPLRGWNKMSNQVTVLVVGYDSQQWLEKCLVTLASGSAQQIHLLFVDNKNNDAFARLDLSAFTVEAIKTPRTMGFVDANNYGLEKTRGNSEFTIFLNQDTVSTPGWIDACLECFKNDPKLGILSAGLMGYDLSDWEPNLLACVRESGKSIVDLASTMVVELLSVTAAAMVIRTDVLRAVGPFDPIFGSYYEDYDLCRRVRNAGYKVGVCPSARVGHFSGSVTSTPAAERRRMRSLIRNRLIHHVRESGSDRLGVLAKHMCCTLPLNVLRGLLRTRSSQPILTTLGAHWDLFKITGRLMSARRDDDEWMLFRKQFSSGRTHQ